MSALPPNDPHGYIRGTVVVFCVFAAVMLAVAVFAIAGAPWR